MALHATEYDHSSAEERRSWLAHCEGFEVDGPGGRIGWVAEIERDRLTGVPVALLVRPRVFTTGTLRVLLAEVADVWPEHGRVVVASPADSAPAHKGRLREYRCLSCGYGAAALLAPTRCPMCSGGAWELVRA